MYDIIIIGAGVIGGLIAHRLSKYDLKVAVLDKDNDVANETTSANSAIIHSGHDPKPGSLMIKMNLRGNELYEDLCKELKVDFERCGAFVVATDDEQIEKLEVLYKQALERNVPVEMLDREELLKQEPNLSDHVIKGISLPSTGIVSPWEVTIAALEDAVNNGLDLHLSTKVVAIEKKEGYFDVTTNQGVFQAGIVINAAGLYSDDVYRMVSTQASYSITPRRGEYFVLDRAENPVVGRPIFPIPTEKSKGILVLPTIHKNILLGPTSDPIIDKEGKDNTAEALNHVREEVSKTVKNIPMHTVIRTYVGLRATPNTGDFIIEEAKDVPGFINLIGIESPGLASAPAISEYVVEKLIQNIRPIELKKEPRVERRAWVILNRMSIDEKQEWFKKDKRFGQMTCRCELVSEGEIVDVIHRNVGAKTVKAVKRRLRPGAGRCQGGFCEPRVINILARELNISPTEVLLDADESKILVGKTKE